jgi:hypothetical protein
MIRKLVRSVVTLSLLAAPLSAQGIKDVTLLGGNWNGTSFSANGLNWNTYNSSNWAIGITAQGSFANPLLNGAANIGTSSPNLADGAYYLFMEGEHDFGGDPFFNAFRISLWDGAVSRDMVFTFATPGAYTVPGYTTVSGSGFTADGVGASGVDRVNTGQNYTPGGDTDFVIALSTTATPEPASLVLFGTGLAGLGFARFRKRRTA